MRTPENYKLIQIERIETILPFATHQFHTAKIKIFHYTRYITSKRLTSWRGLSPHHCASGQHISFEEISQR